MKDSRELINVALNPQRPPFSDRWCGGDDPAERLHGGAAADRAEQRSAKAGPVNRGTRTAGWTRPALR